MPRLSACRRAAYFAHLLIDETLLQPEFYNDFLHPQGFSMSADCRGTARGVLTGVQRTWREPQFTGGRALLESAVSHLERAAKLHGSLATAGGLDRRSAAV
jgi:hypothetical protein